MKTQGIKHLHLKKQNQKNPYEVKIRDHITYRWLVLLVVATILPKNSIKVMVLAIQHHKGSKPKRLESFFCKRITFTVFIHKTPVIFFNYCGKNRIQHWNPMNKLFIFPLLPSFFFILCMHERAKRNTKNTKLLNSFIASLPLI